NYISDAEEDREDGFEDGIELDCDDDESDSDDSDTADDGVMVSDGDSDIEDDIYDESESESEVPQSRKSKMDPKQRSLDTFVIVNAETARPKESTVTASQPYRQRTISTESTPRRERNSVDASPLSSQLIESPEASEPLESPFSAAKTQVLSQAPSHVPETQ